MLDDVLLAEFEVIDRGDVLVELLLGLSSQVAAVHQEQHAPRAAELDQPVDEADGGEGLAAAGRHLDQRTRLVLGEARFQVADGGDLRGPELEVAPFGDEGRHRADAVQEAARIGGAGFALRVARGVRGGQPVGQDFRPVESEHPAGTRLGVETVSEMGFDARGFVQEWQRPLPGGQSLRQSL